MILAHERVGGEERRATNDLRIAGRDIEGVDLLMLILTEVVLVERIRHVEG